MAKALQEDQEYNQQEIVIERPDGSRLLVLAHASPFHDESGRVAGAVNVLMDISERERAERGLAQLAAIVESSEDAILTKDLDGIITSWNQGARNLYGYETAEVVGRHISLLVPPDHRDEMPAIMARLKAGERIQHFETVRMHKDGRRVDVSVSISPLKAGGCVIGAAAIARDISARKRVEQELRDADRRKSEFLAMLAHELRNPLAPLRNGLQIMHLANDDSGAAAAEARAMMERQLVHMVRLIDDLLDLSRITNGKIELRKERLDVAAVAREALDISRPLAQAAGHEITVALPSQATLVYGDRARITQVIANLLNNSVKFTGPGGRIWLTIERQGSDVAIKVKDTGVGIAPEMLPKIFDMFAQAGRPPDPTQSGLGIGLSLVRRLVQMHGGSVEAYSEGLDKGSEFVVRLSAALPPSRETAPLPANEPHDAPRRRILVVDDSRDAALSLAMLLRMTGHETCTAHDGLEALNVAREFRPDVMLLDIGLPKMNGYNVCRHIRQQPWGGNLVIIALTGWGQEQDKREAREAGFDFHLVKPVNPPDLETLLAGLVLAPA